MMCMLAGVVPLFCKYVRIMWYMHTPTMDPFANIRMRDPREIRRYDVVLLCSLSQDVLFVDTRTNTKHSVSDSQAHTSVSTQLIVCAPSECAEIM